MTLEELLHSGFGNERLIESLYLKYLANPWSLDKKWRDLFNEVEKARVPSKSPIISLSGTDKTQQQPPRTGLAVIDQNAPADLRVYHLIQAYRMYGHLMAHVNPISVAEIKVPWQLELGALGFQHEELSKPFPTNGLMTHSEALLKEIIAVLHDIYCGTIGVEYMGTQNPQLEIWLQERIEPNRFKIDLTIEQKKMILDELNKSELFEVFLHTKYVGQKRFSLEGGETAIPILGALVETGAELGLQTFVLGMAHRGRLNVLANILQKSYAQIFSEFEEGYIPVSFEGSGDVKYHKGFSSSITTQNGHRVNVALAPNPSHLEAVDPVVQGQARALQEKEGKNHILPILIHGDAALSGQGVVYETMQLYNLEGYSTGGTIHIVINNQIGFTTIPQDARSTHYCTDIARTFNAPVFHVNAEDPEACVFATNLAVELRQKFHCDVFIDLMCYRKYGHNEADEPAFTQPLEYQQIRKKKPIRELYRDHLIKQGVLERQIVEELEEEFKQALQTALKKNQIPSKPSSYKVIERPDANAIFEQVKTGVAKKRLEEIGKQLSQIPPGLVLHRKLEKVIRERLEMAKGEKPIDWGMAETLAYATLLWEGNHVRLSGQDCCRGTFSHRHALWMDQEKERGYFPLKHLKEGQGKFHVFNSPLSEYAVLGFEFGYSIASSSALVVWEAQFGDFCNGAQVIIDQFLSTCEMKWGQKSGIVLFLPHGYEGQGPEHSSGRMERFLSLCGEQNMIVVNPTNPAQLFHLLRRHILKPMEKPLVVFTPKGLLRHSECTATLKELSDNSFQEFIDGKENPKGAKTLVFCCGRLYYDLLNERKKRKIKDMAIIRVEQLYPFHEHRARQMIKKYQGFERICWVQEEPKNMGAWSFIHPRLRRLPGVGQKLEYVGRPRGASPAVGSFALHKKEHAEIMMSVFDTEGIAE